MEELKIELNKRDQEILAVGAKMKTLEEQHQDYQRHISVLKESLVAKEEHYNMLQADVSRTRSARVVQRACCWRTVEVVGCTNCCSISPPHRSRSCALGWTRRTS